MNNALFNACNGKYASGKGLNTDKMREAMVMMFPRNKEQITDPLLTRKQLELLCKQLSEMDINKPGQVPEYKGNMPEQENKPKNKYYKDMQDYTKHEEYIKNHLDVLADLNLGNIIDYEDITPELLDIIQKHILKYMESYAIVKKIKSGFPKNVVLCHARDHQLQFPASYLLTDVNKEQNPDIMADSALLAVGFPNDWINNLIIKACPTYIYSEPFFWEVWLPKIKKGGKIIIFHVSSDKLVPLILNKHLHNYFKSIGIPRPTFEQYISNIINLAGYDTADYDIYTAYISNDPNLYDNKFSINKIDKYTKPVLIIHKR